MLDGKSVFRCKSSGFHQDFWEARVYSDLHQMAVLAWPFATVLNQNKICIQFRDLDLNIHFLVLCFLYELQMSVLLQFLPLLYIVQIIEYN